MIRPLIFRPAHIGVATDGQPLPERLREPVYGPIGEINGKN